MQTPTSGGRKFKTGHDRYSKYRFMKSCENCEKLHDGSYASGRFCSLKCGRAFATKAKRKEINERVSLKLFGQSRSKIPFRTFTCQYCGCVYERRKTTSKFCSRKCNGMGRKFSVETRKKISKSHADRILRGEHVKQLKSIRCEYEFRNQKIRCDSKVEYACLNYFETNFEVESIYRAIFSLEFEHDGIRNYVPDFIIVTKQKTFVVECKAEIGKNAQVSRKWSYYYDTIEAKKQALIKYCDQMNYEPFFFDKSMHAKFYHNCFRDVSPHADNV